MVGKSMRLGVFSNKNLNPWINWTTLGPPLLEPLATYPEARLIAPPPLNRAHLREWGKILGELGSVDTLFWMQMSSRPEWPIFLPSFLRGPVRRSAFIVDAWKQHLTKIGSLAVLQRLDPAFVPFREGYEELRKRFPRGRFEWLPFGVDTRVFDAVPGERPIFAFSLGRRYEPLHRALLDYCRERGLKYRYTQRPGEFSTEELGRLTGSAQYFVVAPPNLASPERTGGFSPFVMRYLEGLAAGARLLGTLPGSGEYEKLLPLDAILTVNPDGSDLATKLDADRKNPEARTAVERARTLVREEHSWAKRAGQIFQRVVYGVPTIFEEI
jgi:hypothetical protein